MDLMAWVNQYGYIVLFLALMLELVAFPLPGEVLMSYAGFLVFKGQLGWVPSIVTAAAGVSTGITVSYLVGYKLGVPFFHRYGKYVHMGPERLAKTSVWFQRYGNRMLALAYFIPGIRHITGYFSGITGIRYRKFGVYAYLGALFWVTTFISLGKLLGPQWEQFHSTVRNYLIAGSLVVVAIAAAICGYRYYRQALIDNLSSLLAIGIKIFHSMGRVKALVAGVAVLFLGLMMIMFGLIQDYLGNEFGQFDRIVIFLTHLIFQRDWAPLMAVFELLASAKVLAAVIVLTFLWILIKGEDRALETKFLISVIVGGKLLDVGLRTIFHRFGPAKAVSINSLLSDFPSGQTLMVLATFGFITFLVLRHSRSTISRSTAVAATLVVCFVVGISRVYLNSQYPSDVISGYVFGGVWLSLNIILMEVFRTLKREEFHFDVRKI